MATAPYSASTQKSAKTFVARWYFTGMAILMLVVSLAGFAPGIIDSSRRNAPLTLLVAAHGAAFLAWLLLFLAQSLLVATGRLGWHRRLGVTSVVLLALIIPLTFATSTAIMRRGYDLSGDSHISPHPQVAKGELDAPTDSAFNFWGLLEFSMLATAAIAFRRRPEVHKRLMLFANISLMVVPVQHLMGHIPSAVLSPAKIAIPFAIFLLSGVARDYLVAKRVHPLTAILAVVLLIGLPIQGALIGPSPAWHHFASWLFR